MKKIIMMLSVLLAISLSACSQKKTETRIEQKVLVAYFSATGTTEGSLWQPFVDGHCEGEKLQGM